MRRGAALVAFVLACRAPATQTQPLPPGSDSATVATIPSASASVAAVDPVPVVQPAPLGCIVKYYGGSARRDPTGWAWVGDDGKSILYHDGTTREDRWRNPTIEDLFEQRYHTGPITTPAEDYDPGRVRQDAIFFAAFGHDAVEVQKALTTVMIAGKPFSVHKKIKPQLERVAARVAIELKKTPSLADYFDKPGGTFNWRLIAGTDMLSNHSWAVALDLDVPHSNYWRNEPGVASGAKPIIWKNRYPQAVVDAFEAEGFIWGGRWHHFDTMHFEYRPELIDQSCYP